MSPYGFTYNTVTWIAAAMIVGLCIFIGIEFRHVPPGQHGTNLPKNYGLPEERGIEPGPGLTQKDFK